MSSNSSSSSDFTPVGFNGGSVMANAGGPTSQSSWSPSVNLDWGHSGSSSSSSTGYPTPESMSSNSSYSGSSSTDSGYH
ncbi:unnamed protein product [Didymodactylos carnosus]|uniref:Uncharacterized protein n=1 Tax=Didymodactylos carnosus TaxID=1234261 RepID=A0A816EC70_9BILA|nr:unnamed protein product [Didymodactylos carnosus]CAF1679274.1 unnamed protein product [Didymodactylos carnosus]CAF4568349.1 unnamed protein product [Didymodactylos carnosus]CAF4570668.1 unnamed protein product [Didymodactylos carnosus]